ncbi:MAG: pseudaminic acid cytidylyltransferase [Raoultibacter sp.]
MQNGKLAIITARGGSKRIPLKNIKEFCGKPIISYSIEAALKSRLFGEVMVSTDSREIADIAIQAGASVPFLRSSANSDDFATTKDALVEVLDEYARRGFFYDEVCCIYPTAPFVTSEKLIGANALHEDGVDTVLSVTRFSFPPQRGMVIAEERLEYWQLENANRRSQDLEPVFHDAGQFYFCRTKALHACETLLGNFARGFEVSELEVQDIDSYIDWELAELKYERMVKNGGKQTA